MGISYEAFIAWAFASTDGASILRERMRVFGEVAPLQNPKWGLEQSPATCRRTHLGAGERHRSLKLLPKAHLHLHLPAAMRRSAFEAAVGTHLQGNFSFLQTLLVDLDAKQRSADEHGDILESVKCARRRRWLEAGCPYPPSLDSSDLARFDREMPSSFHKDTSLAWDIQFAAKILLEDLPG